MAPANFSSFRVQGEHRPKWKRNRWEQSGCGGVQLNHWNYSSSSEREGIRISMIQWFGDNGIFHGLIYWYVVYSRLFNEHISLAALWNLNWCHCSNRPSHWIIKSNSLTIYGTVLGGYLRTDCLSFLLVYSKYISHPKQPKSSVKQNLLFD